MRQKYNLKYPRLITCLKPIKKIAVIFTPHDRQSLLQLWGFMKYLSLYIGVEVRGETNMQITGQCKLGKFWPVIALLLRTRMYLDARFSANTAKETSANTM